jgi:hypothetical protein
MSLGGLGNNESEHRFPFEVLGFKDVFYFWWFVIHDERTFFGELWFPSAA